MSIIFFTQILFLQIDITIINFKLPAIIDRAQTIGKPENVTNIPVEILETFAEASHSYCIIFYDLMLFLGQMSKLKQCSHVGAHEHFENCVLVSERKGEMLKRHFFLKKNKNLSVSIIFKIRNAFWDPHQNPSFAEKSPKLKLYPAKQAISVPLSQITTKTGTGVEHYTTCQHVFIHQPPFLMNSISLYSGSDIPKKCQNQLLTPLFKGTLVFPFPKQLE